MEAVKEKVQLQKYPAYKDSGVDWLRDIPESWDSLPIRAIFEERNEKNEGPKTDFILSVTKDRGVIPYDEKGQIGNNKSEDIERYKVVHPNDFVINKMNVVIGSLGMSKYLGAFSQVYLVYKPKTSAININYYSYLFANPAFYKSLIRYCTGIMELRESLNKMEFKKLVLPFPNYKTQSDIVDFLDEKCGKIETAIAQKERMIGLLKERKQIVLLSTVVSGTEANVNKKSTGIGWFKEIPTHWELVKIGFMAEVGNGSTPNRSNAKFWTGGSIPWLNSSKVNKISIDKADQFVTKKAVKECHLPVIIPDTVVMAITGEGKTRGKVSITQIETTINQHLAYIKVKSPELLPRYLLNYLSVMYSNIRKDSNSSGSTKGAITCSSIKKYFVPVPPISEQISINEKISHIKEKYETAILLQQQQIEKLKEYKSSLIDAAVTGKIKVS